MSPARCATVTRCVSNRERRTVCRGQRIEPGALEGAPAPVVDHQAARDGRQIGARLMRTHRLLPRQHADEHVLRNVRRLHRITQLAAQPALQPAVMTPVEILRLPLQLTFDSPHSALPSRPVRRGGQASMQLIIVRIVGAEEQGGNRAWNTAREKKPGRVPGDS